MGFRVSRFRVSWSYFVFYFTFFYFKMPKTKSTPTSKEQLKTSKKRKSLTAAQKKEVCLKKLGSPFLKNKDLSEEYGVSKGMICDTLKARERWLAIDLKA